jgi:rhodanese-related sulfurtransferase
MIGSAMAFLIARFIASDWLEDKIGGRLKRLKEGVEQEGWRFVAFLRLVPVFPSIIINYALGLTRIKFSHYFITSYICKIPTVAAYVYVGHAGLEAISSTENLIPTMLTGLTLIGFVVFLPRLVVKLRRDPPMNVEELESILHAGEEVLILDVRNMGDFPGDQQRIAGVCEISIDDLERRLDELAYYTERPIALVSRSEKLSSKAAELLTSNGFAHVRIVKGSIADLRQRVGRSRNDT